MPRDGSNIYHIPPGTEGIPDTTIESDRYNAFIHDVEQDLNTPRPIIAGGTGADDADEALVNLKAEKASQQVSNYDSHAFMAGSFYSATSATNPPVAAHAFAGTAYLSGADVVVEATDLSTRLQYIRTKVSGVWSAWTLSGGAGSFLPLTGGTLTGNLNISNPSTHAEINLSRSAAGLTTRISTYVGGELRWQLRLGDTDPESGGNVGSSVSLIRYDDDGIPLAPNPLSVSRATGLIKLAGDPTDVLGAVTKQYADAAVALKAPLASPVFTGNPTAPTPAVGDDDTSIATTAFVKNGVNLAPATDFNAVVNPGTYNAPTNDCTNTPVAGQYWTLFVMRHSNVTYTVQIAANISTGLLYTRTKVGGAWQSWRLIYDTSQAATGAEYWANAAATQSKPLTVASAWDAAAQLGFISAGATLTPNFTQAADWWWNINGTGTLNNPSAGFKVGMKGIIAINQAGAGNFKITTWGSFYKFPGGIKPVLSSAVGAIDTISYYCTSGNVILCTFNADFK